MSGTSYGVNHPSAVKHWSKELLKESLKKTYGSRFMGKGANSLCQIKSQTKDVGDKITFSLRMQLTGAGVQGDSTLEGNEESLTTYTDSLTINQLRHAVRSAGKMSEQRVPWDLREEGEDALSDWFARRFDTWFFNQLSGNTAESDTRLTGNQATVAPDSTSVIMEATSTASLASTDKIGLHLIDYAMEMAKTRTLPIRPIRYGGKDMYILFVHEYQATDLRRNYSAGQLGDIQKSIIQGGDKENAFIFDGALGVYNNTIIHSTDLLPTAGVTNTRRAVFCGAQALGMAFGKGSSSVSEFNWNEELFDFGNQLGIAAGTVAGMKKFVFNGLDNAVITIPTYAAAHTS